MANEIFISYSSIKDLDGTISDFHTNLENAIQQRMNTNISVFLDKRSIRAGDNWQGNLSEALSNCKVLLILLSPSWLDREWCRNEYLHFKSLQASGNIKKIIPVKWIDTRISDAGNDKSKQEIIQQLNNLQQVDWTKLKYNRDYGSSELLRRSIGELADNVALCLKNNNPERSVENAKSKDEAKTNISVKSKWFIFVLTGFVLISIFLFTLPSHQGYLTFQKDTHLDSSEKDVINEWVAYIEAYENKDAALRNLESLKNAYRNYRNSNDDYNFFVVRSIYNKNSWLIVWDLGKGKSTKDSVDLSIAYHKNLFSQHREEEDVLGKWLISAHAIKYDVKSFEKYNGRIINVQDTVK